MANLAKFLAKNIEGYLFNDLRSLIGTPPLAGQEDKGVGYPLVMTAFAGIELLGALLSKKTFDAHDGDIYFKNYWTKYLYLSLPDTENIGVSLYRLVRHGIAHSYVLKGQIGVLRRQPSLHLKRNDGGLVCIDAVQLANDLIQSYDSIVPSIVALRTGTVNGITMSQRLNEMEDRYKTQASSRPLSSFPNITVAESTAISTTFSPPTSAHPFEP